MQKQWQKKEVTELLELPFFDLVNNANATHIKCFKNYNIDLCTLSSIKTGACPEDCAYCPQSGHFKTDLKKEKLLEIEAVVEQAKVAKANGAKRFCMGAAWRSPTKKNLEKIILMIKEIKQLGLETCVTLGMLDKSQAEQLKAAGLDFYNHNLDSSRKFYKKIITTRTYDERITTLQHVFTAGINVCCGGIMGMGESWDDRIEFLLELNRLPEAPKSIPINSLMRVKGTPLENADPINSFDFIKVIAITRIMFPNSMVRLSAGREHMSDTMQAWCFYVGANSIFIGDKLLTTVNPSKDEDANLLQEIGIEVGTKAC